MVLLREAIGTALRRARTARRRTLREVSRRARVSLGYLSEVERGRKEASSELLASICEALDVTLPELLADVTADLADALARDAAARLARPFGLAHTDLRLAGEMRGPLPAPAGAGAAPVALPAAPVALPAVPVGERGARVGCAAA
ncbi:MAG TPA: helix-turn-helix transcriptional regulator [Pseudonocardia sp.]|nr:helix-turn-helix transcriptional regulator [Pseudonocardia sp.]